MHGSGAELRTTALVCCSPELRALMGKGQDDGRRHEEREPPRLMAWLLQTARTLLARWITPTTTQLARSLTLVR